MFILSLRRCGHGRVIVIFIIFLSLVVFIALVIVIIFNLVASDEKMFDGGQQRKQSIFKSTFIIIIIISIFLFSRSNETVSSDCKCRRCCGYSVQQHKLLQRHHDSMGNPARHAGRFLGNGRQIFVIHLVCG